MKKLKIAVIGGGGAGCTAAWMLDRIHDVTLFEAEDRLGGHAYTHRMRLGDKPVPVDMAVEYFNERLSPNLFAMHGLFGIETYIAPLSFRAILPGRHNSWSNIHHDGAARAEQGTEFDRFHLDMTQVLSSGDPRYKKLSVGEFLRERGYSEKFMREALLPLLTTFSGCNAPSLDYSLMYVVVSFNMSLLSFFTPGYWRKAKGGIDGYIRRIADLLGDRVRSCCAVRRVRRRRDGRLDVDAGGIAQTFDTVVFATHADVTLSLIDAPSAGHRDILGRFEYIETQSVLHSDDGILAGDDHGEYCEFSLPATAPSGSDYTSFGHLTRINNNLPAYRAIPQPILVTFDPKQPIAEDKVVVRKRWKLPKLRPSDFYQKTRYHRIQGKWGMWFCGTDTSLTGHEGAVVSGMVIAERLGAKYPFSANSLATIQFNVIKDVMNVKRPAERLRSAVADVVFKAGKWTALHKAQSHKVIKDAIV